MARYLTFILDGEVPAKDRKSLSRAVNLHFEDGRTYVTVPNLSLSKLEDILRKFREAELGRARHGFDLGPMPKHTSPQGQVIVAYRIAPDDVDLPANPETDFQKPDAHFKSCGRLKRTRALQVSRQPQGHMAGIGQEIVVDEKFAEFFKSLSKHVGFGDVLWKGKKIDWHRIVKWPSRVRVLDPRLSFNPPVPCRICGRPLKLSRATLIALPDTQLKSAQLIRDGEARYHEGQETILLLSAEAARQLTSKYRSGYVIKPVYASDSQAAREMREVEALLDEYVPPRP